MGRKKKPKYGSIYGQIGSNRVDIGTFEGWRLSLKGYKLLVDFTLRPWCRELRHSTRERLTDQPTSEIISLGYREAMGYKTAIAFYRMPVYVRFIGYHKCDYRNGFVDEYGHPCEERPGAYP